MKNDFVVGYEGSMWNGISTLTTPQIRCISNSIPNSTHLPSLAVSASAPRSPSSSSSSDQVSLKGLGLAALNLTASRKSKSMSMRDEELVVDGGGQLSGSDVLLALQQADSRKKKKKSSGVAKGKKYSRLSGSGQSEDDDNGFDQSSSVKPLMIKADWGRRIEELDKRIREISEI